MKYVLCWLDDNGVKHESVFNNLRDCEAAADMLENEGYVCWLECA
jgi:hypothetical protein